MGDISTWSAVDNSNTAAPPDGWPENQSPSSVNNCARAMMGAIRRWYDTVTAQLSTINTSLTTFLPLSGGTMTGALHVGYIYATNVVEADVGFSAGPGGAYAQINSSGVTATVVTANTVVANTDIICNRDVHVDNDIFCSGVIHATGGILCNSNITGSFSLTGGQLHSTGNVTADTSLGVGPANAYAVINSSGSFNVSGAWSVISDQSVKEQVVPYTRGLAAIAALTPVTFRYQPGTPFADGAEHVGLMAQDVELIIPELVGQVTIGDQTLSTLSPGNLVYVMCNALRELAARVEQLEATQQE